MGRYARNDFALGDYFLPARTTVLISQFITHRDARYFPDPLRFDPNRFSPEGKARRAKFTYFPFGAGARQCIGESFAWMEGALIRSATADHVAPEIRNADANRAPGKIEAGFTLVALWPPW